MSKKQLINNLSNIENFFLMKDKYKNNPILFAEDFYGVKLLSYQKILLKTLYEKDNVLNVLSKQMQKELNFTTKARLTQSISAAILGRKVLFLSPKKDINKYIDYIKSFIESNMNMFEENDITYNVDGNIVKFNTGGSIEFA